MLNPKQFPKLMLLSLLASAAVGLLVYRFSGQWPVALAMAIILFIADWVGIKMMMK